MTSTTFFITSIGQGEPAIMPVRKLLVSYSSKSGCSSSAMNIVGTPSTAVHLSSCTACKTFSGSKLSTGTIVPSWVTVLSVPSTQPKQWKNGLEQRCPSRLRRLHFGGFLQAVALDGGLAQLVLLDLAARRHRVLLDEVHVEGDLEAGDVLPAILLHVLLGEVGVRLLLYYRGGDLLAVLFVRDAVDLHV